LGFKGETLRLAEVKIGSKRGGTLRLKEEKNGIKRGKNWD